jgi:hypothetical protein
MLAGSSDAETSRGRVVAAVAATESEMSARVSRRRFCDPPSPPERDYFGGTEEGVTDFRLRRTRVSPVGRWWSEVLAETALKRWPWLRALDEEDACDGSDEAIVCVYAGTSAYFGSGDVWSLIAEGDPRARRRSHADPLWITELLRHVDEAWPRGDLVVRGSHCARYAFRVDLNAHRDEVELPVFKPHTQPPRLTGEVAVDRKGRVRQITWREIPRRRPRARGRAAALPTVQAWETTELWDFGVPVDIELPEPPEARAWPIALAGICWRLWQARREYRRTHHHT